MGTNEVISTVALFVTILSLVMTTVSIKRVNKGVDDVDTGVNLGNSMIRVKLEKESRLEEKIDEIVEATKVPE